jgi:hypothetical protein
MSHDRRIRRALLVLIGLAVSASTGCLISRNLRPTTEVALEPSPAGKAPASQPTAPTPAPAPNPTPGLDPSKKSTGTSAKAAPVVPPDQPDLAITPTESRGAPASMERQTGTTPTSLQTTPKAEATPLLDAALQRVEAVTRQHRESLVNPSEPAEHPGEPAEAQARSSLSAGDPVETKPLDPIGPILITATAEPPGSSLPSPGAGPDHDQVGPPAPAPALEPKPSSPEELATPKAAQPEAPKPKEDKPEAPQAEQPVKHLVDAAPTPGDADTPAPQATATRAEEHPHPEITELCLCRNVLGFGSYEPLDHSTIKAGERVLVYCELAGLEYEPRGDAFLSRLSSRIELRAAGNGPIVWEQAMGSAEDVCRKRRRDYYVNYRIELPRSLKPGSYHLRLIQTDLVAGRATSGEIPLVITP